MHLCVKISLTGKPRTLKRRKGMKRGKGRRGRRGKRGRKEKREARTLGVGPELCLMEVRWYLSLKDLGSLTFGDFGFTSFRRNGV